MQMLFASLMLEEQQAVSSEAVTRSFGWTTEQVGQQHDAQELFTVLLPALKESLKGTSGENLIRDLLHIKTVQTITCSGCKNATEIEAEESTLFAHVEGFQKGLEESLQGMFCIPEWMTGDDQYSCDKCQGKRNAMKSIRIRSLPPLLMIALNRFTCSADYTPYKVVQRFPFPMKLDMWEFTEHGIPDQDQTYELTAVIVHSGNCVGGHYTACIRDIDDLGHWEMPFQNSKAEDKAADEGVVKANIMDCVSAKQVVATVLSFALKKEKRVTVDKLSAEIGKQTGVPWSRSYKRTHGSFPKFLEANPDTFALRGNQVGLVERPGPSGQRETSSGQAGGDTTAASPAPSSPGEKPKTFQNPQHEPNPGHNWFFFNDSNVAPMLAKDLELEFGGRRCAYMLLYRKKSAPRPAEAKGNPAYNVPTHIMEEITKINQDLAKQREDYEHKVREREEEEERKKNEVQVDLRYHFNYKFENGMLTTDSESVTATFQRTQTLGELRIFMAMLGSGRLEEDGFRIHRMKCWDNKTHLYDELADNEKTLEELSIENGTILFAWDGCQVEGQPVPTGVDSEPLTLQLKEYLSPRVITHSFPKNLTLGEFKGQVSRVTGITEDLLRLQLSQGWVSRDTGQSDDSLNTLESLQLGDKACILFDASSRASFGASQDTPSAEPLPKATDEHFCVYIENRCDRNSKESPVLELEIEKNMTVGNVKQLYMNMYSIQCDSAALLEKHPIRGLQDPYNEELTVGRAGITSNTHLVLDLSKVPLEFKLFPDPTPDQEAMQVAVNKQCTVEECFVAMAQVAGLEDPADWHLCTSSFMFDRVQVLDDWDMVLEAGSHFFVLERGRLPPKGHTVIPVWLYPTPKLLSAPDGVDIADLAVGENQPITEPFLLDNVEIRKDAKLEDLRSQIVGLLADKKNMHVGPSQLRLRMIEGVHRRLRKVLRDPKNTLRNLRVDSKTPVGVQVVSHGATPCKEEIVLSVGLKNPVDGTYGAPQELLWDTRCGTSATKLKQDIATGLLIPEEMLVIAKHLPKDFTWKKLQDTVKAPTSHDLRKRPGKKQTGRPKVHRQPCRVEDGDVIGVIRMAFGASADSVKEEDFCSPQDIEGRQQVQQEREKKRLERQQKLPNGLCTSFARRPQVPLKIKVADYS